MTDMRYYETFYGIHTNDWSISFGGTFSNHHKILVKDYINNGCDCTDTSVATDIYKFLYPEHIAKVYFIEGVISGHVTFGSSGATAYICAYRVSLCKIHEDTTDVELFTTGWVTVDKTLDWDTSVVTTGIGEECVFPFWIDAWENKKLSEFERIYLKVESTCTDVSSGTACSASACTNAVLWHSNDPTWTDVTVNIPFIV